MSCASPYRTSDKKSAQKRARGTTAHMPVTSNILGAHVIPRAHATREVPPWLRAGPHHLPCRAAGSRERPLRKAFEKARLLSNNFEEEQRSRKSKTYRPGSSFRCCGCGVWETSRRRISKSCHLPKILVSVFSSSLRHASGAHGVGLVCRPDCTPHTQPAILRRDATSA
jgi:hypothetical protein